jgi:hypothetical protein
LANSSRARRETSHEHTWQGADRGDLGPRGCRIDLKRIETVLPRLVPTGVLLVAEDYLKPGTTQIDRLCMPLP